MHSEYAQRAAQYLEEADKKNLASFEVLDMSICYVYKSVEIS